MKKELPEIFKKNVDARHSNNKKIYYASDYEKSKMKATNDNNTMNVDDTLTMVEAKIRKLLKSSRYIFNINVEIKTDQKVYHTQIAGKVKNSIVTVDGEVIPIASINDIIIKDRL